MVVDGEWLRLWGIGIYLIAVAVVLLAVRARRSAASALMPETGTKPAAEEFAMAKRPAQALQAAGWYLIALAAGVMVRQVYETWSGAAPVHWGSVAVVAATGLIPGSLFRQAARATLDTWWRLAAARGIALITLVTIGMLLATFLVDRPMSTYWLVVCGAQLLLTYWAFWASCRLRRRLRSGLSNPLTEQG